MSHRVALTLAVALTLLFAAGIVNGRDRLLGVAADPAPTAPRASVAATEPARDRIIEVTVPASVLTGKAPAGVPIDVDDVAYADGADGTYYGEEDDDHDRAHDDDHDRTHDDRDEDSHDD